MAKVKSAKVLKTGQVAAAKVVAASHGKKISLSCKEHVKRLLDIHGQGNNIFNVVFSRRNDKIVDGVVVAKAGEITKMKCRLHVTKGVKGALPPGQRLVEDFENECMTVYSMDRQGFRRIPLDSLISINGNGVRIEYEE